MRTEADEHSKWANDDVIQPLYYAASRSVFSLGRNTSLVICHDDQAVVELDGLASRVLALCQGVRTLEAHAAVAWQSGVTGDPNALAAAFDKLLETGLLRPWEEAARPDAASPGPAPRLLATVAVITADCPAMLRRCLESLVHHADAFGRRLRFLVIDGSRDDAGRRESRAVAAAVDAQGAHVVVYIGRDEAEALQGRLADRSLVDSAVTFGLVPGEIGANRNLAVLFAAGERLLMVDDDVVCDPWVRGDRTDGVALGGHADLREWAFFDTRQAALAAAGPAPIDLLAAHDELLGTSLGHLAAAPNLRRTPAAIGSTRWRGGGVWPCGRRSPGWRAMRACTVRATCCSCPAPCARCSSRVATVFDRALGSREVHRLARQTLVTHEPFCMAYCMGLAGESLMPPFMPVGRNEDGVFGAMLSFIDPPPRSRIFRTASARFGPAVGVWRRAAAVGARDAGVGLLYAVTRSRASSTWATEPADRLRALGHGLRELGAIAPRDFSAFVCDLLLGRTLPADQPARSGLGGAAHVPRLLSGGIRRVPADVPCERGRPRVSLADGVPGRRGD